MNKLTRTLSTLAWICVMSACTGAPSLTPPVELAFSPIAPPSSFEEALTYIESSDPDKQISGMWAILDYQEQAHLAIHLIVQNLSDEPYGDVRVSAARVLGELGPLASEAVPNLIFAMQSDSFIQVRVEAAIALGKIGDKSAVPALVENLSDDNEKLAVFSAKSVALITSLPFPDSQGGGFRKDSEGNPLIVLAVREWWEREGQYVDWSK